MSIKINIYYCRSNIFNYFIKQNIATVFLKRKQTMENKTTIKNFASLAPKYFTDGYSCSEAIAKSAQELGIADDNFVSISTSFSGGMSSRCLCGAVAGAQMVLGLLHGKNKDNCARALSKEFYERFCKIHKVTCCKVLSGMYKDFHSKERKQHCINMVADSAKILDEMLEEIGENK